MLCSAVALGLPPSFSSLLLYFSKPSCCCCLGTQIAGRAAPCHRDACAWHANEERGWRWRLSLGCARAEPHCRHCPVVPFKTGDAISSGCNCHLPRFFLDAGFPAELSHLCPCHGVVQAQGRGDFASPSSWSMVMLHS